MRKFQSALPLRGATEFRALAPRLVVISIRAPLAGSDRYVVLVAANSAISIRAPLAGSDHAHECEACAAKDFNPRSPCGERRAFAVRRLREAIYFNPRSPCGERPVYRPCNDKQRNFNPRSPCGERHRIVVNLGRPVVISIRAPLAGSDPIWTVHYDQDPIFQSARPLRGATVSSLTIVLSVYRFQSALPLRGATTVSIPASLRFIYFNPRSPCGERPDVQFDTGAIYDFNPRSPCGERPKPSITISEIGDFNPRSPCGERRCCVQQGAPRIPYFNPRSPCGERRGRRELAQGQRRISIRAPLAGSDQIQVGALPHFRLFQSALPLRGATRAIRDHDKQFEFQSALPLRGATISCLLNSSYDDKFQSALPLRGATSKVCSLRNTVLISIRAPLAGSDTQTTEDRRQ